MSKTKFTEVYIKNLPIKEKAYNKSEDNLRIRVYPTGTKSWSFYKTDLTGNRKPQKLGTYPDISLAKAKQMSSIQSANIYTTGHGIETSVKGISYKDFLISREYQSAKKGRSSHKEIMRRLQGDKTGLPERVQNLPIKSITTTDIQEYIHKRKDKDDCKDGTINKNLTDIRSVFAVAFEKGVTPENIMSRVKNLQDVTKTEKLSLTPDERLRLIKTANDTTLPQAFKRAHMPIFIALGLDTGCRKAELLRLRWSDFSNDNLVTVDNIIQGVEYKNWQTTKKLVAVNRKGNELSELKIKELYGVTDRTLMVLRFYPSIDQTQQDLKAIDNLKEVLSKDDYKLKVDSKRSWYLTIAADMHKGKTERTIGVQEKTMQQVREYLVGLYESQVKTRKGYAVSMFDDNCNPVIEGNEKGNIKGYVDIGFMQDKLLFPQDKYAATAKKGSIDDIRGAFKTIRDRAGLPKTITPHTLRHHFCSDLAYQGTSPFEIMRLADHKDIKTTMRYIHYVKKKDFSALDEADKKRGS